LLEKGETGEIYNVGANQNPERSNLAITEMILAETGASPSLIEHRHGLRPGHDQRYAVSTEKIRSLGWTPRAGIEDGIAETVRWYAEHRDWWGKIKSGEYREYYEAHYGRPIP
jgi:dTDP-glucose 4,6-dehydratase